MAIHAGECEERDGDYFGPTVNRVARLLAIGHGGQLLASGAIAELVVPALDGGGVTLRDLGEHLRAPAPSVSPACAGRARSSRSSETPAGLPWR